MTSARAPHGFRDQFFRAYAGIRRWHDECWRRAKGGVDAERTILGRIVQARSGKGELVVTDWNRFNALTEYRACGSAADLLKFAMVRIAAVMPEDVHIVATVHDELILDAPFETDAFCREMVEREMTAQGAGPGSLLACRDHPQHLSHMPSKKPAKSAKSKRSYPNPAASAKRPEKESASLLKRPRK